MSRKFTRGELSGFEQFRDTRDCRTFLRQISYIIGSANWINETEAICPLEISQVIQRIGRWDHAIKKEQSGSGLERLATDFVKAASS